jgi:periplasmic protein TonB
MSSLPFALVGSPAILGRVARPLACSLAIHVGLVALAVFAGSMGLASQEPPRTVWLDLEPMVVPTPPAPPVPAPVTPPQPVRPRVAEPRKTPQAPSVVEPPAPPQAQPPTPPREVAVPEPPAQSLPSPPQPAVAMESPRASEPDRAAAPPAVAAGAREPIDSTPLSQAPQERGGNGSGKAAVASRTPDAGPGGPIVRAARPKGGYQVRPVYPEVARRAGIQGTTLLRIHIEADGHVSDVSVQRSAGHQSLDEAAAEAVRRWRFEPALNSVGPVSMWAVVPVEFRISDRD